jgi:ElaB/YqjD/DUF883 family membrane-anchored ribosome-binding protein
MASSTAANRAGLSPDHQTNRPARQPAGDTPISILSDLQSYTREYVHQQPEKAALICIGVGFILGWKLKPW